MANTEKVLIVDDEEIVRRAYENELKKKGYDVETLDSAEKALETLTSEWPGILVTDIVMPGMGGMGLLKKVKKIDPEIPVVLMTGQGDIPMAVQAIHDGAYEFLEKPFETSRFLEVVKRAMEKRHLVLEVRELRSSIASQKGKGESIIGKSASMEKLRETIKNIAKCDVDVLILGETGTGKDLVARYLHDQGKRENKEFVAINCGAIPEAIIESELFGHEAGSFTGATKRRIGKFEYAHGGTVFLDEIESMPLHLQVKLLHVLQDRHVQRVGSNESVPVDVRVVAATKEDLKNASAENKFRKDLYYRLNVVQIIMPPLRELLEDIPILFQHFVLQSCARYNLPTPTPPPGMIEKLQSMPWEGNVRELKNEAEKFVLGLNLNITEATHPPDSNFQVTNDSSEGLSFKEQIASFEKNVIEKELARQKGDLKKTQEALGIPKQTLYDKMKTFELNRKNYQ